jgi:hypothetical protein
MKWLDLTEEQRERYKARAREYKKNNIEKIKKQRLEYDKNYYKNLSPERKEKLKQYNKSKRKVKEKIKKEIVKKSIKPKYSDIFIEKAKKVHGDKYDYSKCVIINSTTKVTILCHIHGEFNQRPNDHLNGYGCPKCGKTGKLTTQDFVDKAISVHGNTYDYSLSKYVNTKTDVKIICSVHGEFNQRPNNHLNGKGCKKCGMNYGVWSYRLWEQKGLKSNKFDSFKLYILECWDNDERFFKVGKTFNSISQRFRGKNKMPYNFEILKIINGDAKYISEIEVTIKNNNKNNSYLPKKEFNGRYECYAKFDINQILH